MNNENSDLITIIIPVYNGERYLDECIVSALRQSYQNLQVIIVNDGSTDKSRDIIEKYDHCDSRVLFINKENSGVSMSRNVALKETKGKYVCFLDQDDVLEESYIEYLLSMIKSTQSDISVLPHPYRFRGKPENAHEKGKGKNNIVTISGEQAMENMLLYKQVIAPWSKMIFVKLIQEKNIVFDKRFFSGEGFLFSLECYNVAKRVVVGNKMLYCYRVDNPLSGMTKYSQSIINSSLGAQEVIYTKFSGISLRMKQACLYAKWHTYADCLNMIIGCNAIEKNKDQYNEIINYVKDNSSIARRVPIRMKEKYKAFMYQINPYIAASIINTFRKRRFTKEMVENSKTNWGVIQVQNIRACSLSRIYLVFKYIYENPQKSNFLLLTTGHIFRFQKDVEQALRNKEVLAA